MIRLNNFSLRRGPQLLLDHVDVAINPGQRIGLVGANGCGKTSLFKAMLGELHGDSGELQIPRGWRIAHLAQETGESRQTALDFVLDGDTVLRDTERAIENARQTLDDARLAQLYEKLEEIRGYDAASRGEQLLHGLGFSQAETQKLVAQFSGGWRIRLNLARTLMCPSDLLLLDEPTNHLDLDAILWLEQWLASYQGTLLIISHDRDFLDNVVDGILHIEQRNCTRYSGNYSGFERARAERLAQQQASFEKQQQRKREIESFVARFRYKATKARQAQSRLKELQRMRDIAPAHVDSPFHFNFRPGKSVSGGLLSLSQAYIGYGSKSLLESVDFDIQPGARIGLLGPNGAGKSTLIKTLTGDLRLIAGQRMCNDNTRIGYFAQHQLEALDLQASAFLHVQRLSPAVREQDIRDFIGGFDFHGDRSLEPVENFSGGEKARLALALIVWQAPNLLLLDEPTNHLDLEMREALTEALQGYEGALVMISHDRHLLRSTVDEFFLVADGRVEPFDGDLQNYQGWLKDYDRSGTQQATSQQPRIQDKKALRKQGAEQRQQLAPLTKKLKKLEGSMAEFQLRLKAIEVQLADPEIYGEANRENLRDLLGEQVALVRQLADAEEQWLQTQEELESR